MTGAQVPDPGPVMQAMTAYWVSGALHGCLDLDLFTRVANGKTTVASLAVDAGASERGVRALANAMCSQGFLEKRDGEYALTATADTFLRSDKQSFLGGFHQFINSEHFWQAFGRVSEAAVTGKSVGHHSATAPQEELWEQFAEGSLPTAMAVAARLPELVDTSRPGMRILDVAAGSGAYGITLARACPESHVTFLDWPNVLDVTLRHAKRMGVGDRCDTIAGSAFDLEWGGPYDIVVAGHFLHHFSRQTCVDVIRKARAALAPDGVFATSEFVADERREEPGFALLFAVAMLVWTDEGDAYTLSELESLLAKGGLPDVSHHVAPGDPASWLIARG
ncbi:MAG: methyltransferase [Gaiellaceae bacterium]